MFSILEMIIEIIALNGHKTLPPSSDRILKVIEFLLNRLIDGSVQTLSINLNIINIEVRRKCIKNKAKISQKI